MQNENPYSVNSVVSDAIVDAYELGYSRGCSVSYFQTFAFVCFMLALSGAFFYCLSLVVVSMDYGNVLAFSGSSLCVVLCALICRKS